MDAIIIEASGAGFDVDTPDPASAARMRDCLKNGIIKAAHSINRCAGKLKAGVAMTGMEAAGKKATKDRNSDQGPE